MSGPLVSAVITTYDRPELVKRAVESVLEQTYSPVEIIVVEDGTDTGVKQWLVSEGHDEVIYIAHETNQGCVAARNTGLNRTEGTYVAFLDDDDEWKPDFIRRCVERAESLPPAKRESLGVVYADLEVRTEDGEFVSIIRAENRGPLKKSIINIGANTLDSSLFMTRDALNEVGGWDESLPTGNVHDMWMELAIHGYRAETIHEPLVVMYEDEDRNRMTTDTQLRIAGVREYVQKWLPTYRDWFGRKAGTAYGHRYYARVIARLAAGKLIQGDTGEARIAISAIFNYSDETTYNVFILIKSVVEAAVKRVLPPAGIRRLKTIIRRAEEIY